MRRIEIIRKIADRGYLLDPENTLWLLTRIQRFEEVINRVLEKGTCCDLCNENHEELLNVLFKDKDNEK